MEIVKYGDYVIYGRTSTDFWKETSVDIIIHVSKNILQARPDEYEQNFQTGLYGADFKNVTNLYPYTY